jgi:hypothetical protein
MEFKSEKQAIREAMLAEQSDWLEQADRADSFTQIAIAKVIAEAFEKAAAKYKDEKKTEGWGDDFSTGFYGADGDDELGVAPALLDEG